jgi:hypothetical protein
MGVWIESETTLRKKGPGPVDAGVVHAVCELLIEVVEVVIILVERSVRLVAAVVVVLEEVPP